ncbi:TPA: MBOAT family protein [Enterococcus faecalis]
MSYVSATYLAVFLPLTMIFYQVMLKPYRWTVLLIASLIFFYLTSHWLLIFILLATCIAYVAGRFLDDTSRLASLGIISLIGILVILKYSGFIVENVNSVASNIGFSGVLQFKKIGVPLGISFYTLQAVSYVIDVKRKRFPAEKNIARLALYLSFFPTIMEGPIVNFAEVSSTLFEGKRISYTSLTLGTQRILWGLFKKMIIADRLNPFVAAIFDNPISHNDGAIVLVGAIAYTIQLYMDFSGVIDISLGVAEIFNVRLIENFRQPFFSRTAAEFWQRWHISLGLWFKEYIFFPVLLSRPLKKINKKLRKKVNKHLTLVLVNAIALFFVWLCNGFWHGTGWRYVFFGMYYFVILTIANLSEPLIKKIYKFLKINPDWIIVQVFQRFKLLFIVVIGEMFFRANGLRYGLKMFYSIFMNFKLKSFSDGSLLKLSIEDLDFYVVFVGVLIVLIVSLLKERNIQLRLQIGLLPLPVRWSLYYGLILFIVIFGAYGEGYAPVEAIYVGF